MAAAGVARLRITPWRRFIFSCSGIMKQAYIFGHELKQVINIFKKVNHPKIFILSFRRTHCQHITRLELEKFLGQLFKCQRENRVAVVVHDVAGC